MHKALDLAVRSKGRIFRLQFMVIFETQPMAETDAAVAQHIKPFWSQELVQHGRERLFPGGHGGKDYQNLELLGRLGRRHSVALIRKMLDYSRKLFCAEGRGFDPHRPYHPSF
jgi:hypothetical protein